MPKNNLVVCTFKRGEHYLIVHGTYRKWAEWTRKRNEATPLSFADAYYWAQRNGGRILPILKV